MLHYTMLYYTCYTIHAIISTSRDFEGDSDSSSAKCAGSAPGPFGIARDATAE